MNDNCLPIGIVRSLQTSASQNGVFKIVAIDHWDSLRELIDAADPSGVSSVEMTSVKLQILDRLAKHATAVILDPVYSIWQAISTGTLPGQVGFLCKVEREAFLGPSHARQTELLEDWNAAKAKQLGASGVKLFLYYHPDSGELAEKQEALARRVAEACFTAEIPLFLEPIVYSIDPAIPTASQQFASQRRALIIESARRMAKLRPAVLKLQFPIDGNFEQDEAVWRDACAELNDAIDVPWAILSGGDPFEIFKDQLQVACEAGCSGFLAGRALWQEVTHLPGSDRLARLDDVVLPRLQSLNDMAESYGKSWTLKQHLPTVSDESFRTYGVRRALPSG